MRNPRHFLPASSCSVKFETQPADAFPNSTITSVPFNSAGARVTVQLLGGQVSGQTVSLSTSPDMCATGPSSAVTDGSGIAVLEFAAGAPGPCELTVSGYGSPVDSLPFNSVEPTGELGCTALNQNTETVGDGTTAAEVAGVRHGNLDDSTCVPVPYTLTSTCGADQACSIDFVYDPLEQQADQLNYVFHFEWPPRDIPPGGIETIENTEQFFVNGTTSFELDFCPGIVPVYESGVLVGIDPEFPLTYPIDDQDSDVEGLQAGCLIQRVTKQLEDPLLRGKVQLIEDAYVQGDYAARRN